jgi:metallophosphoesterase superfamily enzyme
MRSHAASVVGLDEGIHVSRFERAFREFRTYDVLERAKDDEVICFHGHASNRPSHA